MQLVYCYFLFNIVGMMLALSCDYRIMREDRGFLCLPEVDLHMPFTPGMNATISCKITNSLTLRNAMLFAERFNAKQAFGLRLIDHAVPEKEVITKGKGRKGLKFSSAVELANQISSKGDDKRTFKMIKDEMYKSTVKTLQEGGLGFGEEAITVMAKL